LGLALLHPVARLMAVAENIRLAEKKISGTNTLAYFGPPGLTKKKMV
jgi:hypothetical protein